MLYIETGLRCILILNYCNIFLILILQKAKIYKLLLQMLNNKIKDNSYLDDLFSRFSGKIDVILNSNLYFRIGIEERAETHKRKLK